MTILDSGASYIGPTMGVDPTDRSLGIDDHLRFTEIPDELLEGEGVEVETTQR